MTQSKEPNSPSIGVATVVLKDEKIAIGKDVRKGENVFGVPGGHWETGETLKECAVREVKEECGVNVDNARVSYKYYQDRSCSNCSAEDAGVGAGRPCVIVFRLI